MLGPAGPSRSGRVLPPREFQDRVRVAIHEGHPVAHELFCGWLTALPLIPEAWEVAEFWTSRQLWAHAQDLDDGPNS